MRTAVVVNSDYLYPPGSTVPKLTWLQAYEQCPRLNRACGYNFDGSPVITLAIVSSGPVRYPEPGVHVMMWRQLAYVLTWRHQWCPPFPGVTEAGSPAPSPTRTCVARMFINANNAHPGYTSLGLQ